MEMGGREGPALGIRKLDYGSAVPKKDTKGWTNQGLRMQDTEPDYLVQNPAHYLPAGDLGPGTCHSDTSAVMVSASLGHCGE